MSTIEQTDFRERPVGEVVAEDYRRAGVFKRFGIDFCCGGGRTVQEACERKGVAYEELAQGLLASTASRSGSAQPDPRGWKLDFLADYIVNVHHGYVRETLPVLLQFSQKVARVHGERRPELVAIARLVEEIAGELEQHMRKEEEILFPYIRALVATGSDGGSVVLPGEDTADGAMRLMEEEHDHAGELMRQIRELSGDFVPPEGACTTYRASYVKLEEFEEDLHRHVHLENNLLFPGTEKLERAVTSA
ncbi:MAG: iron-sulfur cluster repair di-iron protein [Gemmatimonadota bacterium]